MKTRFTGIFTAILAIVFSGQAFAQNINLKSDTLVYPANDSLNGNVNLQDFGPLSKGEKSCHTIYLKNAGSGPLIVNQIVAEMNSNNQDFSAKAIPQLPTILLQNEIVSIADLCFSPSNPTVASERGFLDVTISVGSKSSTIYAGVTALVIVDTVLQKPCVTASLDADIFGPIIMDGDVSHTLTIESNRYDSLWITLDSLQVTKPPFSYSGITSPYHLAPREIKTFTITYSPRSNQQTVVYRSVGKFNITAFTNLQDTGQYHYFWGLCNQLDFNLPGVAIPPTADSISTSLAAGSTDILAMISDNSVTTNTFHFTNNTSGNLKITGVDLKNKKSFAITDIQPSNTLPFILTPGQSMSVTVSMTTVTNGVYYDEVIITAENALISMDFQLQGLRKNGTQAGVRQTSEQALAIYPNPSHGEITVDIPGIRNAKIEVLDMLGRIVAKDIASEKWTWNSHLPAGSYTLHISGATDLGATFQSYDRFIIQN